MREPIYPIPAELREQINLKAEALDQLFEAGEITSYSEFVDRLFKPIKTVEFNEETGFIGTEIVICPRQTLLHATVGISGEGGESLDATKKVWAYNKDLDHENLIEELADGLFYTQAACNILGIELNDLVAHNMTKLLKRYPDGYSDQAAQARADKQPEEINGAVLVGNDLHSVDRSRNHIGSGE